MLQYIWPMALVILSNTVYQVCAKSVPEAINPFASLTVTYLIGTVASLVFFFLTNRESGLLREYGRLNWAPFVLGVVIVALEAGWIYIYKAGWQVNSAFIVQSAFLAVSLLVVGYLLFHEAVTANKLIGVVVCMIGLAILNYR